MRGISGLAIIAGGVCDVVLSAILGVPLVIYVVSEKGLSHVPKERLQDAVMTAIHSSPMLYAMQLVIGLGCSVFGGFVAASIAKQRHILNGVLAAWLCVGMGVYSVMSGRGTTSMPLQVLLIAITPLCYFVGARLKRSRVRGAMV
jgi:hypothetical protein